MTRSRRTPLRVILSFPVVVALLLVVMTVFTVRDRFSDPDMWWHLKTGEIIWNTHHIPRVDIFSYTTHHHAYIPHEWLAQLLIYGVYHFAGYTGLMLWLCAFASLFTVAGYALCSLYSGNCKVAFMGAVGIWFFSTVGLSIRPQLIGYCFLICELIILHLGRARSQRWYFVLPPLFAAWVNCHGSFLLGIVAMGIVLASGFLDLKAGLLVSRRTSRPHRIALVAALVLSIAALFCNPIGFAQLMYPVDTMFAQSIQKAFVIEWQPPSLDDVRTWVLFGIAGLVLLICLIRRSEIQLEELALVAMGFVLAVQHSRMLFVFGAFAMPVLSRLLATSWDSYDPRRDLMLPNAALLLLAGIAIYAAFPNSTNIKEQIRSHNPVKAVEFINKSGLYGNLLNDYLYGGYLIWASPEQKVFVDGRGDVFEWTGVLRDYLRWSTLQDDPRSLLRKYRIGLCLLSRQSAASRIMQLLPEWRMVYSDETAVVFVGNQNGAAAAIRQSVPSS